MNNHARESSILGIGVRLARAGRLIRAAFAGEGALVRAARVGTDLVRAALSLTRRQGWQGSCLSEPIRANLGGRAADGRKFYFFELRVPSAAAGRGWSDRGGYASLKPKAHGLHCIGIEVSAWRPRVRRSPGFRIT
ncbi:unnamed protein product [Nesidiocoris tenuis]|uniref:Uncharacterized protein n=1 Tax=Nesidiocoris tenuis TaxID=355587 RepID=A0A6H5GUV8_9HEMI|nr:unnamed protein product [Nesidiocoris tenuis]